MTGVEILATQEVVTNYAFNGNVFWITLGIIFFIFSVFGLFLSLSNGDYSAIAISVFAGFMLGSLFGFLLGTASRIPTEYETQYKVTISDEVPMNDFLDRYEIVDQDGKIYTVRERD